MGREVVESAQWQQFTMEQEGVGAGEESLQDFDYCLVVGGR